ncbi:hypothetical protein [Microbacterium sp. PA5]|uniref:hypothetical protein n=1 Tax=Microbacterium sp. PA5 TaxID=3416654 RepID=UPI003CEF68A0
MGIRQVEIMIDGTPHTVQVNDDDKNYPFRAPAEKADTPPNKERAPRNKAVKPATKKPTAPAVEAASDPDASE